MDPNAVKPDIFIYCIFYSLRSAMIYSSFLIIVILCIIKDSGTFAHETEPLELKYQNESHT